MIDIVDLRVSSCFDFCRVVLCPQSKCKRIKQCVKQHLTVSVLKQQSPNFLSTARFNEKVFLVFDYFYSPKKCVGES